MGPSGSGKTTLLNLLSQRAKLESQNCEMEGQVLINGHQLARNDYAKVGAYVQQDDALMDIYTARELFEFACRIRLGHDKAEAKKRVDSIIERLDLGACCD